jgi:hypothetical protein
MNTSSISKIGKLAGTTTLLTLALCAGAANAAGDVDPHGFNDIKQMIAKMPEMTDKNKDGTITKKEYLEMQSRMFDMASKKKGKMTMDEYKSFLTEIGYHN